MEKEVPETAKTVRPSSHEAEIDTDRTIVFNHGLCTNLQAKEVRSWYGLQIYLDCLKADKGVLDGVFYAELSEFFTRELSSEGYSGCEVRAAHARTEIIIRATHTQEVLGEKGRRIRELTALVQKRFKFGEGAVELYAEKVRKTDRPIDVVLNGSSCFLQVQNRGLSAIAQCESLRYKLLGGLAVRRSVKVTDQHLHRADKAVPADSACYGVLRFIMESGAKGCEVVVSGKLRAARAKSMKFTDGVR